MEFLELPTSLADLQIYALAAVLAMARISALMSVMPAFTRLGVTGIVQAGIALALALPLVPLFTTTLTAESLTIAQTTFLLMKEVVIGVVLGLVLGIPIWAAEAAGNILDLQRGSSFAELIDPSATTETSVTGTLFAIAMVALFFVMGGLPLMLRVVYDSYSIWPMSDFMPVFSPEAGRVMLSLLDDMMGMGMMLAVPIVLALLLTDFSLALVARASPHLHIFDLSLSVKSLVFSILLVLYGAFLVSYMEMDLRWLLAAKDKLEVIHGPVR